MEEFDRQSIDALIR